MNYELYRKEVFQSFVLPHNKLSKYKVFQMGSSTKRLLFPILSRPFQLLVQRFNQNHNN